MVVLAASICTRGGKAVLSRQFRDMQRSRIEGLLASFPKLADSGTQHTTVEQDNVRFVYQPLDELYMVLITNRQSNILQDIDSLHLFAQVVTSVCKNLDEREILRNAFELLSAFDELVTLGYRENLTISQIKTFLDMDSHEERIQEIIARNKELEASEERKRKAKQLEMQRKEMSRNARAQGGVRAPAFQQTYQAPANQVVTSTYDSYNAEKNKQYGKTVPSRGKGMQLGKKSKTTNVFEQVRDDFGAETDLSSPLVLNTNNTTVASTTANASAPSSESLHVTINEKISAKLGREGQVESFEVKGDMKLRISDNSVAQVKIDLDCGDLRGAQLNTHPKVDKTVFKDRRVLQLQDTSKSFPVNNSIEVMRWRLPPRSEEPTDLPIKFSAWVNEGSPGNYSVTVEYELTGSDTLSDVSLSIPFADDEPVVSSTDAVHDVSDGALVWNIGHVDQDSSNGTFDFEVQASSDSDLFPMAVHFTKTRPFVEVDVSSIQLISMDQSVGFSKDIHSVSEGYQII